MSNHKIKIQDEEFYVENKVYLLLRWYSDVTQALELCRNAQKAYYARQDQERLKRAKAMERKLDILLNGYRIDNNNENELFK